MASVFDSPVVEVEGLSVDKIDLRIEGRRFEIIGCVIQPTGSVLQISITAVNPGEEYQENGH